MAENTNFTAAMQADIESLRERFPRTADLYREACALMFFRYGLTPTASALYQLVRKGSMSVPAEALKRFWSDLRERSRVDLQNADLPDQVRQSAGQLVGEIWSLARKTADDSITALRQNATIERDAALAQKNRLQETATQLSAQLDEARDQIAATEATMKKSREELSAGAAAQVEMNSRLDEARMHIERLRDEINLMANMRAEEIEKFTNRILLAEQRYTDLAKRALVDLDRERTATSELKRQHKAERRTSAARLEEIHSDIHRMQLQLVQQGQELSAYMSKAELLADERDRAASHSMRAALQCGELEHQLTAERAKVVELRGQLERLARTSKSSRRTQPPTPAMPRQRRRAGNKRDE